MITRGPLFLWLLLISCHAQGQQLGERVGTAPEPRAIQIDSTYAVVDANDLTITSNTTFSDPKNVTGNIRITPGNTLTVTSTVEMAPHRRIFVEPGAQLVVDGGLLTSRCEQPWGGVEVWGVSTLRQSPSTNQGVLVMNNAGTIENAEVGVRLFSTQGEDLGDDDPTYIAGSTGGILHMHDASVIRNCGTGVWFKPYKNKLNGVEQPNRSHFLNCVLEKNAEAYNTMNHRDLVRMEGVWGVVLNGATLQVNEVIDPNYTYTRPVGIRSYDSKFTAVNSTFHQLPIAVRATTTSALRPCYVRNNTFTHNDRGVLMSGVYNAEITGNTFTIPSGDGSWPLGQDMQPFPVPYGAYLYKCEGYEVEENDFAGVNAIGNAGLIIDGSKAMANEYYRNHFTDLFVGSNMQGNNRTADDLAGLLFRCNLYGNEDGTGDCTYAAAVTRNNGAVAPNQGTNADPAGNRFYPECPSGLDETDLFYDNGSPNGLAYYHHIDQSTDPGCASPPPQISLLNTFINFTPGNSATSSCPEDPSIIISHGQAKAAFLAKASEHGQLKSVYDGSMDGSDPADLWVAVNDPFISSSDLRNMLIASVPLKDKVLNQAVRREPAMDPWQLVQVLLAASPLNPDVLVTVRNSDLDANMQDMVTLAQGGSLSWKQLAEAELGLLGLDAQRGRHDYVRIVLQDSTGAPLDSVAQIMADPALPATAAERLAVALAQEQWATVDAWLSDPEAIGLDPEEIGALAVVAQIAQDPAQVNAIMTANVLALQALAAEEETPGHATARNLLDRYVAPADQEPVVLPGQDKSLVLQRTTGPSDTQLLRVKPNPAADQLMVTTLLPMNEPVGYAILYNAQGIELERIQVRGGPMIFTMDVQRYAPGMYRLALWSRTALLDGTSITIAR